MNRLARRRPRRSAAAGATLLAAAILLFALLAAPPPLAAEEARVGDVVWAKGDVTGQPKGGTAGPLAEGSPVLLDLTVATGRASGVGMTFGEKASIQLGARSRLTITQAEIAKASAAVGAGKARIALDPSYRGDLSVDTPSATLGVKGTILVVEVRPHGDTVVWVLEGVVAVNAKAGGAPLALAAGEVTVIGSGRAPSPPIRFDPKTAATGAQEIPPQVFDPDIGPPVVPCVDALPPDRGLQGSVPLCPPKDFFF